MNTMNQQLSGKKTYEKPQIIHTEKIEARAVVCTTGKTPGGGGGCSTVQFS